MRKRTGAEMYKHYQMNTVDWIEVQGNIVHETDKAILMEFGMKEMWLPKSQMAICEADETLEETRYFLKTWLHKEKF